jgi:GNAT superfamily N-acetyltransferase
VNDGYTVRIVPWSTEYEAWLRHAIGEFFEAGVARGGDLLNTKRNVDTYYALGLKGAAVGDPCLLAKVGNEVVAFVLWIGSPKVLDTKTSLINAIGSYTDPAWRNKTIATALREEALRISRERGYTNVVGPVQLNNYRGVQEFCLAYGAWPTSVNFELPLA